MCGRFTSHHSAGEIAERFQIGEMLYYPSPRYNIAPTQFVPVITATQEGRQLSSVRWGLVPRWSKDTSTARHLINARAETVGSKPTFKNLLRQQRCVIPADGWFEWKHSELGSQPYYFRRRDGGLIALAGLWDEWRSQDEDSQPLRTCTIITAEASDFAAPVHSRMPVILKPAFEEVWLDPATHYTPVLIELLMTYDADDLEAWPVARAVNAADVDHAALIEPELFEV